MCSSCIAVDVDILSKFTRLTGNSKNFNDTKRVASGRVGVWERSNYYFPSYSPTHLPAYPLRRLLGGKYYFKNCLEPAASR